MGQHEDKSNCGCHSFIFDMAVIKGKFPVPDFGQTLYFISFHFIKGKPSDLIKWTCQEFLQEIHPSDQQTKIIQNYKSKVTNLQHVDVKPIKNVT